jgi:hypothetical protein
MYNFKIVIPYWCDKLDPKESTRYENIIFVEHHLKKLCSYMQQKGLDVTYQIYDFSVNRVIENSIHIPFPLNHFKKSQKWNITIFNTNTDFFIGMDADMIIHEKDYEELYNLLLSVTLEKFYNFNCKALQIDDRNKIDYNGFTTDNFDEIGFHYYVTEGYVLSMGGFFICPTRLLKDCGGYNENLTHRGGEDGEILDRINTMIQERKILYNVERVRVFNIIPYHLPHEILWENRDYQKVD